jgi:hypothetical protein
VQSRSIFEKGDIDMKRIATIGLLLFCTQVHSSLAAELPLGDWNIDGNGFPGVLHISAVSPQGTLTGTVYGQPILGTWDGAANRIVFMRVINRARPDTFQIFTGYLFGDRVRPVDITRTFTLTGSFQAFAGTGASAQVNVFGWFAQQSSGGPIRN